MKITIAGAGYVGMSLAVLLAQKHEVTVCDIDSDKIDKINDGYCPISDDLADLLMTYIDITATQFIEDAYTGAEVIFICVPTDLNGSCLDTSIINTVIEQIREYNTDAIICIKSTVPIGFTDHMQQKYPDLKIVFSPEFLREGQAVYDNQYPSRIVVGGSTAGTIMHLLYEIALNNPEIRYTTPSEAEAIKLFSNSYLAMRVSFFNELDSFCLDNKLNTKTVIDGVCLDPRIGNNYNNPSFGYGGYCLPKDSKQLLYQFNDTPQSMFSAIVESNEKRKQFIADKILNMNIGCVGIYRLNMKSNSDNCRESALWDIVQELEKYEIICFIYDPECGNVELDDMKKCKIILTNRMHADLEDVKDKVFTRDIFGRD